MNSKLSERNRVIFRSFNPAAADTWETPATTWLPMKDYHRLMVIAFRTIGSGNIGQLRLFAATSAAGAGAVEITSSTTTTKVTGCLAAKCTGGISRPGVGMLVAECSHDDIAIALPGGTHVMVKSLCATGTDELGLCFIFSDPRVSEGDLTKTLTQEGGY